MKDEFQLIKMNGNDEKCFMLPMQHIEGMNRISMTHIIYQKVVLL